MRFLIGHIFRVSSPAKKRTEKGKKSLHSAEAAFHYDEDPLMPCNTATSEILKTCSRGCGEMTFKDTRCKAVIKDAPDCPNVGLPSGIDAEPPVFTVAITPIDVKNDIEEIECMGCSAVRRHECWSAIDDIDRSRPYKYEHLRFGLHAVAQDILSFQLQHCF